MDKHLRNAADEALDKIGSSIQKLSNKKVLLTGAAGFLGAHFVHILLRANERGLLEKPVHITAMDNYMRGYPDWLQALSKREDLTIVTQDIIEPFGWQGWTHVIHAASIASPIYYRIHPIATMDANVIGLRFLLDAAMKHKETFESFLFFSSSEIYGDPDPSNIPTTEEYRGYVSCTGPRACYDESKRYGETLCVNFFREHKVPVKIARPFNNYGPGLKISDRRVLPDFFRDVLANRDITMLSDGSATRTFCYITDAMNGYMRMFLSECNGESFNIGVEKPEISMKDLANLVLDITGRKVGLKLGKSDDAQYLVDNPNRRCPIISKARTMLGYEPVVGLHEGLTKTYKFYLDNSTAEDK